MKDFSRNVTMFCDVCGNDQFSTLDKMPFEYLEPGNGFEEHVVVHMQSSRKFKVICKWQDKNGEQHFNEQIRDC